MNGNDILNASGAASEASTLGGAQPRRIFRNHHERLNEKHERQNERQRRPDRPPHFLGPPDVHPVDEGPPHFIGPPIVQHADGPRPQVPPPLAAHLVPQGGPR